jgi:ABC-type transport system involved in multi-copper enzyme maturation permease subunit
MIWLTWRQFRTKAIVVYSGLVAVAVALAVTGPRVAELHRISGTSFVPRFASDKPERAVYFASLAVVCALPGVIGAFWGAPLVAREIEDGTYRLVWNQSITRTRWLATKLGLISVLATGAGLISLAVTWWNAPFDQIVATGYRDGSLFSTARLTPALFGMRGIVPIAYVVLAFVIGVAAGVTIRRSIPALAVTLAVVVAIQVVMPLFVQAHLLAPKTLTTAITASNLGQMYVAPGDGSITSIRIRIDQPGSWTTVNETVDADGREVDRVPRSIVDCTPDPADIEGPPPRCFSELAAAGYRQHVSYQPASRFWPLQEIESAILLLIAAAISGFCFWRIRRDLS